MSNSGKTFEDQWAFMSEIKLQLGAASYEVNPLPECFKSGREKYEALFLDASRKLISRRIAMQLTSKKTGRPYFVCSRDEPSHLRIKPRPASAAQSRCYTLDDLIEDDEKEPLPPPLPPPLPLRRETTADYLP